MKERLNAASDALITLDNEMSSIHDEIINSQTYFMVKANIVSDILSTIQNLYKVANKQVVIKIQDEFYEIFEKGDVKLDVKDDILTIKAERHTETEKKDKDSRSICCERSYGSYSRQFDVSGIDTDKISAKYENGVLKLTMPKKEAPKETSKHLEIE